MQRRSRLAPFDRVTRFLLRHPVGSLVVAALLLLLIADMPRGVVEDAGALRGWFVWLVLAHMAAQPFVMLSLLKLTRQPPHVTIMVQWAFAVSPALFSVVARFDGAPAWLPYAGALESMALLVVTTAVARRSVPPDLLVVRRAPSPPPSGAAPS